MNFLQRALLREPNKSAKIGIYAGMGAEAGYHFQNIFHEQLGKKITEMKIGDDKIHPQIFTISDPWLPRKDKGVMGTGTSPLEGLKKGIQKFNDFGVDFLLAPCNTLMFYKGDLQRKANFQIIDIVDETAKYSKRVLSDNKGQKTIGVLATGATIKSGLYSKALEKYGMKTVRLDEEDSKVADELIERVKSGDFHDLSSEADMKEKLKVCFSKLKEKGADAVILGYAQISLMYSRFKENERPDMPIISSSDALAKAGVERFTELYKQRVIQKYGNTPIKQSNQSPSRNS
ncbi:MAG: amino acid racemase [Proteobacteria bacterium]|nr:amino acid racemase [Pseudomonadota bacterium]